MDRTVYVGLYLQGAVLSALSIFLYTLTFRKLREVSDVSRMHIAGYLPEAAHFRLFLLRA